MPYERTHERYTMLVPVAIACAASIVELLAVWLGWPSLVAHVAKPIPALALAFASMNVGTTSTRALSRGLLLAAIGDIALERSNDQALLVGLACFAGMHLCYVYAFARIGSARGLVRRIPLLALPYAAAAAGLVWYLWPHLGGFAVPTAAYAIVLAAMAGFALNTIGKAPAAMAQSIAAGGVFFLISDAALAFGHFVPAAGIAHLDLSVLVTYYGAQLLIATGTIGAATPATTNVE